MCQIFIIGQCDNIFFLSVSFISFLPVAYVPEELNEAALLDEDVEGEDSAVEEEPALKYVCQDKDLLLKDSQGFHDSPPVDFSSHEMDSESHLSESSDRMSDFESAQWRTKKIVQPRSSSHLFLQLHLWWWRQQPRQAVMR